MSERKVINVSLSSSGTREPADCVSLPSLDDVQKYFPPDFDPSKIPRRKIPKDTQQVIRLMAPFSMRCEKCGEYIYKGKKFNARKETAVGEEYYGIKIFRFYIKCTLCSSEITFKTDPKNADYICEHGAKRNFENWVDSDPSGRAGFIPDAAADDDYDSDGNKRESAVEKDAMADLEKSQEASRREMETMDELADLRQRNARMELSHASGDPAALLDALHAEKESAEEEARRKAEQEEDDQMVRQFFSKVPTSVKGKAKAEDGEGAENGEGEVEKENNEEETVQPALTVKRAAGLAAPSIQSLLAAKGKGLDAPASTTSMAPPKRKREGMQKLLGIKKKTKA
ncbi:hypothetical protein P7C73_g5418, partial [Tremellales sp. Uapishka_1]